LLAGIERCRNQHLIASAALRIPAADPAMIGTRSGAFAGAWREGWQA